MIPDSLLRQSLETAETRMKPLDDSPIGRRHATYLCWRVIQKSQCHFGDQTLNKTRILPLYQKYIPEFASKSIGEFIIRQYLGTFIPLVKTYFLPIIDLKKFHSELTGVVIHSLST